MRFCGQLRRDELLASLARMSHLQRCAHVKAVLLECTRYESLSPWRRVPKDEEDSNAKNDAMGSADASSIVDETTGDNDKGSSSSPSSSNHEVGAVRCRSDLASTPQPAGGWRVSSPPAR